MRSFGRLRAFLGGLVRTTIRRDARRYLASARNGRAAQHQTLRRLIDLNADSRFSRAHRLDEVRTPADLRARLPVASYDLHAPWIDELRLGRTDALLGSRNPLLMFSLTSGTTADAKFIPVTAHFLRDYRRGWQVWGIHAFDDHPGINARTIVQISGRHDAFRTPGGTPCGSISGLVSAMQKRIVRSMYTVPTLVSQIDDPAARHYTLLRIAVADPHVGMVMTANPSTLIQLARMADERRDELIRDIHDGSLSPGADVPHALRARLARWTGRADRRRARQLERIVEVAGALAPRDYWAETQLVAVWTGGSAGAYLPALRRYYGDAPIRDHGLSASEGRMTIPLADGRADGLLDVHTHFFEFLPEAERNSDRPVVLTADELEEGQSYDILLTTSSGLYRYDIRDVVRCTGFHGTTPLLEFLHKGAHISSLTGEKITESQVVEAVRSAAHALGVHLEQYTVAPEWGEPPRYLFLTEAGALPDARGPGLAPLIDRRLQELNCEYREKRESARLEPIAWRIVPAGSWQRLADERLQRTGAAAEQYKHPCLVPDLAFCERWAANAPPRPVGARLIAG